MAAPSYTYADKFLHWVSALVIIWALASGFYIALFEVTPVVKDWVSFFNVSLTTVFVPFFVVRLFLSLRRRYRAYQSGEVSGERLASFVHGLIYGVVTVVLVTGVLMMDRPINVFNLLFIPQPLNDLYWIQQFLTIHIWACVVLSALVFLHLAAVAKHELSGRRVLVNMWSRG